MKIVVLNGSPRKGGNTEIMAEQFVQSVRDEHDVVVLPVGRMHIRGCLGCGFCYAHQGECVQKDEMQTVYDALRDADLVVFASPIYWFDITAQLKTVIDRLYANGSTGFHFHKTALLLDAGADGVFTAATAQYKAMTSYLHWEDLGIVTVPNMVEKGSMRTSAGLNDVIALAKSLS